MNTSPHHIASLRHRAIRGSALLWIIVAFVALVLLCFILLIVHQRSSASSAVTPTKLQRTATYDKKKAASLLQGLQSRFDDLLSQHQNGKALVPAVRSFTRRYPKKSGGYQLLSQVLLTVGDTKGSYAAASQLVKLKPDQPEIEVMAGTLAMQLKKYKQAAAHYSQAVSLDPSNAKYRVFLGNAQALMGQYDRAQMTLLTALKIDSNSYQAHAVLSSLYAMQDKIPQALDQIKHAIDLLPNDDKAQIGLYMQRRAKLLIRANRFDSAISVLKTLPLNQLYSKPVLEKLANCYRMLGQPAQAAACYEKARVFLPQDKQIIAAAIRWHLKAGEVDQAKRDLDELRNFNSQWPQIESLQKAIDTAKKSK